MGSQDVIHVVLQTQFEFGEKKSKIQKFIAKPRLDTVGRTTAHAHAYFKIADCRLGTSRQDLGKLLYIFVAILSNHAAAP